jgi:hypothetical protein
VNAPPSALSGPTFIVRSNHARTFGSRAIRLCGLATVQA